ncbi:MAG: glycosyltransferase [Kiritimatiellia bacterium]
MNPAAPNPLVSVVVPTFNRPDSLSVTLESIAAQTYRPLQVIVVNDAGCDASAAVERWRDRLDLTYVTHAENRGLAAARNTALREAAGTYVAYLDDDDRFLPGHVATLVGAMRAQVRRAAYADSLRIELEPDGRGGLREVRRVKVSIPFDRDRIILKSYLPVQSVMHERSCLDETGGFDESLRHREDWDLWMRLCGRHPFLHVPEVTSEYFVRINAPSLSNDTQHDFESVRTYLYAKNARFLGAPVDSLLARLQEAQRENAALKSELARIRGGTLFRGWQAVKKWAGRAPPTP